jgi:uncharacterized protein YfaP (DUF2135 family)
MYCIKCGKEIKEGAAFCIYCGAKAVAPDSAPEAGSPAEDVFPAAAGVSATADVLPPAEDAFPAQEAPSRTDTAPPQSGAKKKARLIPILAALVAVCALAAVGFLLDPFDLFGPKDIPREYAAAEAYLNEQLALLDEYAAAGDHARYFDAADSLDLGILRVIESENSGDPYPAGVVQLARDSLELLDASKWKNGHPVLAYLNEKPDYAAMARFYSSGMIDDGNRADMVDMMFRAFAEEGDFARARRVVRELLNPFTRETLTKSLAYQLTLSEEYGDTEAAWGRLGEGEYDRALAFENGMAKVARNVGSEENKIYEWGLIDADGGETVSPRYDVIGGFLEGRAAVKKAGLWGFIDESGNVAIDIQYEDLKDVQDPVLYAYAVRDPENVLRGFYGGFAPVKKNGAWGYIDANGNPLGGGFVYQDLWYFSEGYATVEIDRKYGLINSNGHYVIEPNVAGSDGINYDVVRPIYEGLAGANWNGRTSRGVVNKDGRLVIWFDPEQIDLVQDYREGLASVRRHIDGIPKWGFIDRSGNIVIPIQYDSVSVFIDGVSRVSNGGKLGLIDESGRTLLPIAYDEIGEFSDDIAYVRQNDRIGFVRRGGEILREPIYETVTNFSDGLACVRTGGLWGVIDAAGNTVLEPTFENMKAYSNGVAPAMMNGKWGYVDSVGYFVAPPRFDRANEFSEGRAAVSEGGKYFYIFLKDISQNLDGEVRDEEGALVSEATVKVYAQDDARMTDALYSTRTDAQGMFKVVLPKGAYSLVVSKDGYLRSASYEEIGEQGENYAAQIVMIRDDGDAAEPREVTINVGNALTGEGVGSASVRFRKGYNNRDGAQIRNADGSILQTSTDGGGDFRAALPRGIYTAEVSNEGFATIYINFPVGMTGGGPVVSKAMTEVLPAGETRITLEWGANPQDLDAHLAGPVSGDYEAFHIYYPVKGQRIEDAMLDKDDTEGNGFETTTIYRQHDGVYKYSVFDFSNGLDYSSGAMSRSGARVSVYRGGARVAVFDIPANRKGNLWEVFQLDGDRITPINNVTAHHDVSYYVY